MGVLGRNADSGPVDAPPGVKAPPSIWTDSATQKGNCCSGVASGAGVYSYSDLSSAANQRAGGSFSSGFERRRGHLVPVRRTQMREDMRGGGAGSALDLLQRAALLG